MGKDLNISAQPSAKGSARLCAPKPSGIVANSSKNKRHISSPDDPGRSLFSINSVMKGFALEFGVFCFSGLMILALILVYNTHDLPDTDKLWRSDREPHYTLLAVDGSPISVKGTRYGAPIRLSTLPPYVVDAVLAVEDRNFHHHIGVNPLSILRAVMVNTQNGAVRQGGSTITQQLAKNLFLSSERTVKRKIQELLLAFWLEQRFSKNEILTLYLNRVYLGSGAFGIDAASFRYFGKPASELALNEAALIAGLLKAPSRYNPNSNPVDAGRRAQLVIESMVTAGFLTQEAGKKAIETPIYLKPETFVASGYFVDHVRAQIKKILPDNDADLVIQTSFDPSIQFAAETGLYKAIEKNILPPADEDNRQIETAIVIVDSNGAVRAMIGGRSYGESQFNRVTQARRQPGSAFKPFVFIAALEAGLSPEQLVLDAPITLGKWAPDNYKSKFYGDVTLTDALARSLNSATIRLQEWAGRDRVRFMARAMGFDSRLNPDAALALGTDAISPLELAQAYVPMINNGISMHAHSIISIKTKEGVDVYHRNDGVRGVAASEHSIAQLNQMLGAVTEYGTGRNARIEGWSVAGKTGTTQDSRDAWFAGHVGGLVAVVWTGYDDNRPMKDANGKAITGGRAPAQLWQSVMGEVTSLLRPNLDQVHVEFPKEASGDRDQLLPFQSSSAQSFELSSIPAHPPSQ